MDIAFNTFKFVKRAILAGFTEKQAEFQADEMTKFMSENLVTKSFLKNELREFEIRVKIFLYQLVGGSLAILGGMQTLFHFLGK